MDNIVTINGVDLEFDWGDMNVREKYIPISQKFEERVSAISEKLEGVDGDIDPLEEVRAYKEMCQSVFDYFDEIFGEGTASKLFHGTYNPAECIDAVNTLALARVAQSEVLEASINRANTGMMNRAQRRSAAHK